MHLDISAWLNLALRWFHFVAGIAWIGSSFYFMWLDNHLRPPREAKKGVGGELWAVHGGGFYHKQKYLVAPAELPPDLHWFKWEAYFTWISGFLLLCLMYYLGAELYLIDRNKADLAQWQAIGVGVGSIILGWLVYDGFCRTRLGGNATLFGMIWFAVLTAAAWALSLVFSDRGAFIHVGAIIGTVMAANVFMVIIPNQRKVVADMIAGRAPDPALGRQAKQRSVHNNYMTLPVLFIMVSHHYPMVFGNPYGWLLLAGLSAVGVLLRHFFNLRHIGRNRYELVFSAVALFLLVMFLAAGIQYADSLARKGEPPESFARVQTIVARHCAGCHSARPAHADYAEAPGGVTFDTAEDIRRHRRVIYDQAVAAKSMPLGNQTGMTGDERRILGAWALKEQAKAADTDR